MGRVDGRGEHMAKPKQRGLESKRLTEDAGRIQDLETMRAVSL